MQRDKNEILVFVQTDLLLQENLFGLLRECILNLTDVEFLDEFYYDAEKEIIMQTSSPLFTDASNLLWIREKLEKKDCIFISLTNLEKVLSL